MKLCGPNNSAVKKDVSWFKKKKKITCFREICKLSLLLEKKVILYPNVSKILIVISKEVEEGTRPLHKVELVSYVRCPSSAERQDNGYLSFLLRTTNFNLLQSLIFPKMIV